MVLLVQERARRSRRPGRVRAVRLNELSMSRKANSKFGLRLLVELISDVGSNRGALVSGYVNATTIAAPVAA
jgi:hypothetical protein